MGVVQAEQSARSPQGILVQWAIEQEPWVRVLVTAVLKEQGPVEKDVIDKSFETCFERMDYGMTLLLSMFRCLSINRRQPWKMRR